MSVSDTLVLAWHGTRSAAGREQVARTTARVAAALPGVTVHAGWVDVHDTLLPETLAAVGDCTLVPCFLAPGYHVTHDIPDAVAASPHRVVVADHLGGAFTRALLDRVAGAGGPGDAIVLAVVASRRDDAQHEVARVAGRLEAELGVGVRVANLFGTPSVTDAVDAAHASGHADVLVLPYTLAPGLWRDRLDGVAAGGGVRLAEALGDHPDVVAAIIERRHAAIGHAVRLLLSLES